MSVVRVQGNGGSVSWGWVAVRCGAVLRRRVALLIQLSMPQPPLGRACWHAFDQTLPPFGFPSPSPCSAHDPTRCRSLQQTLSLAQNPSSQGEAIRNASIMVAMLVALRFTVYLLLRYKTARI